MIIRKYLHSCILLEKGGKKLLFDPGAFSFIENKVQPEELANPDVLIVTHSHLDHCYPEALKKIIGSNTEVFAGKEIRDLLAKEGIQSKEIITGAERSAGGFSIVAFEAPHEAIPAAHVRNTAYLIDGQFLHPGDSLSVEHIKTCEVLFLPVAGPWNKLVEAVDFAVTLKPKIAIPIHDAPIKDFMLERVYAMCKNRLEKERIEFKSLNLGEALEI